MPISSGAGRGRALGASYILYIALLTIPITVYRALHPNGWTPGDWLINYEAGFVRRGLPGEAILLFSHLLHLSPVLVASFLPLVLYELLYFAIWQLYRRSSGNFWILAALVSPATLAAPILDPVGAFRKELLVLLALAAFLLWFTRRRPTDGAVILYLSLVGPLAILAHEGLLPYLIYLFGAVLITHHDLRRMLKIVALPALAVALTFLAVVHHRGSLAAEQTICQSLGTAPPVVCSGAIAYLANGTDIARGDVVRNVHAYHYLFFYPMLALLALLPLGILWFRLASDRRIRRDLLIIAGTVCLAVIASLPLFLYAMDWGRWIYIHIVSLFLLLLFVDVREGNSPAAQYAAYRPSFLRRPQWVVVALLVYATCWNLPHYGNYPKKGYFNVPLHLLKQRMDRRALLRNP